MGIFGYIQILRLGTGGAGVITVVTILWERTLATVQYKTYEKWHSNWLVLTNLVYVVLLTTLVLFLLFSGKAHFNP
jgi:hypothetical protein